MRAMRQDEQGSRQHAQTRGEHPLPQQGVVQLQALPGGLRDAEQPKHARVQDA